jgi:hypothetical protein
MTRARSLLLLDGRGSHPAGAAASWSSIKGGGSPTSRLASEFVAFGKVPPSGCRSGPSGKVNGDSVTHTETESPFTSLGRPVPVLIRPHQRRPRTSPLRRNQKSASLEPASSVGLLATANAIEVLGPPWRVSPASVPASDPLSQRQSSTMSTVQATGRWPGAVTSLRPGRRAGIADASSPPEPSCTSWLRCSDRTPPRGGPSENHRSCRDLFGACS